MEAVRNATKVPYPLHPFYPQEAKIVGYLANEWSVAVLLGTFALGIAVIIGLVSIAMKRLHPHLQRSEKAAILWFVISGTIHLFFEGVESQVFPCFLDLKLSIPGYFSLHHVSMGGSQHLFAQQWKEYAYSDSRYLTSDPFVLCMETVTALIVSLGQIYGDVLYYATSMFDHYHKGLTYCRPEAYYFWGYFFFMNFIWIVIPGSKWSYLLQAS
ncbi:MAG: hypothetical protein M1827_006702 [Pycnora praestabilis]|nr:MAG: hypothetical protein M1827_006702 [Pycnora praestabilis]